MHKHILFVLDYYLPHRWWSETVFENIISRLLKSWYHISILTSHFDPKLKTKETDQNLTIYRTWKSRFRFMFSAFFVGIKILKQNSNPAKNGTCISAIHTSTYGWAIPASLLWVFFRKKVILTVHEIFYKLRNFYKWNFFWRFYRLFERIIFRLPYDIYHCVSYYTMNCVRICYGISDNKLQMIHNGIDSDFWNSDKISSDQINSFRLKHWRENKFVVLYFWHAGKSKGIDYLIQSVPEILKHDKDILFVFNFINSHRKEQIKSEINSLHIDHSRIQLFDWFEKENLREFIASVDLIVAPSISEWFWSVHTEVVSIGKPLLTTNIASIPEVIFGNVKMIPPRSTQKIIESILNRSRINNPEYIIPVKTFSRDRTVEELKKLY